MKYHWFVHPDSKASLLAQIAILNQANLIEGKEPDTHLVHVRDVVQARAKDGQPVALRISEEDRDLRGGPGLLHKSLLDCGGDEA